MAKVKIEEILDHLSSEMRRALEATLEDHFPDQEFNAHDVFRTFKRKVARKCSTWETVPDRFVDVK